MQCVFFIIIVVFTVIGMYHCQLTDMLCDGSYKLILFVQLLLNFMSFVYVVGFAVKKHYGDDDNNVCILPCLFTTALFSFAISFMTIFFGLDMKNTLLNVCLIGGFVLNCINLMYSLIVVFVLHCCRMKPKELVGNEVLNSYSEL